MPVLKAEDPPVAGFIKYWIPVLIYATIIFYLSAMPGKDIPQVFAFQDKLVHILEYLGFGLLVNRAFWAYGWGGRKMRFWLALAVCVLYGLSDEFHQLFVPYRSASLFDVLADLAGSLTAGLFYLWQK